MKCESHTEQGHIWEWGNEQQVGEGQLVICALPLHDQHWLPRPRAAEKDRTIQTARGAEKAPWTMTVPPTSGTPPGVPGGLSITLMKLINKSTVQNGPHINEPPHRIGWRPLYESRRQRGRYQALEGGAKDGSFLGNMENPADFLKLWGSFEPHRHRTEHLSNNKWSNKFGSQFMCGKSEVNVLRRQPDLLTPHVKWGLPTPCSSRQSEWGLLWLSSKYGDISE